MTVVVNLISGPGSGKTAIAGRLLGKLKGQHVKVGIALEYATEAIYEGRQHLLREQDYIFAKQRLRFQSYLGKVDYLITDTSLILALIYAPDYSKHFRQYVVERFLEFNNKMIFVQRSYQGEFQQQGRNHDLVESVNKDAEILTLLQEMQLPFLTIGVDDPDAESKIIQYINT